MIRNRLLLIAVVALAALSLGSGCPTIPKLEDRVVELAAGGSTTATFVAAGVINTYSQDVSFDLANEINLRQILDDAGIDAENLHNVKLAGVSYRVVIPDTAAAGGRAIEGGTITIQREGGIVKPLVTDFSTTASSVTPWKTATLDAAGVTVINDLLLGMLEEVRNGTPLTNTGVTCHVSGVSTPTGERTDFTWELRLNVSLVGTVEIKVLN